MEKCCCGFGHRRMSGGIKHDLMNVLEELIVQHGVDEIIIPGALDGVHFKAAIKARNRWMIGQSDYVVTCVDKTYGGAYDAMCYAKERGVLFLNLHETSPEIY